MQNDYEAFIADVNTLAATLHIAARPAKDISLADLSDVLVQIERDIEVREEWERRLREKQWEREEKEEQDFCSARGVYIVYNGPRVYTYQGMSPRVVVSISSRYHTCCKTCGDSSVKLCEGVCKACDVH